MRRLKGRNTKRWRNILQTLNESEFLMNCYGLYGAGIMFAVNLMISCS